MALKDQHGLVIELLQRCVSVQINANVERSVKAQGSNVIKHSETLRWNDFLWPSSWVCTDSPALRQLEKWRELSALEVLDMSESVAEQTKAEPQPHLDR